MSKDLGEIIKFNNNGISMASYNEVVDAMKTKMMEIYGNDIDVSDASADGQYIKAMSMPLYNMAATIVSLFQQLRPDSANGTYLDIIASWVNMKRSSATKATCYCLISSKNKFTADPGEFQIYNKETNTIWRNVTEINITRSYLPYYNGTNWTIDGESDNFLIKCDENKEIFFSALTDKNKKFYIEDDYIRDSNNNYVYYRPTNDSSDKSKDELVKPNFTLIQFQCENAGSFANCQSLVDYDDKFNIDYDIPSLTLDNNGPVSTLLNLADGLVIWQFTDATNGTNEESDSDFRKRRKTANNGLTTVDNLTNALFNINGIEDVYIVNNNTDYSVAIDSYYTSGSESETTVNVLDHSIYVALRVPSKMELNIDTITNTIFGALPLGASSLTNQFENVGKESSIELINGGTLYQKYNTITYSNGTQSINNYIHFKICGKIYLEFQNIYLYVPNSENKNTILNSLNEAFRELINDVNLGEEVNLGNLIRSAVGKVGKGILLQSYKTVNLYDGKNKKIDTSTPYINKVSEDLIIPLTDYLDYYPLEENSSEEPSNSINGYYSFIVKSNKIK